MSVIDPQQAEAVLSGVTTAAETVAAVMSPTNPQAAIMAAMIPLAQQTLTEALNGLQGGQLTPADVVARSNAIAKALEDTHNAWAAVNAVVTPA